jgi:hypothetical protein
MAPLSFINPWLRGPGVLDLKDIASGSNPGCNIDRFSATQGWDAVSLAKSCVSFICTLPNLGSIGLGTPNFVKLHALHNKYRGYMSHETSQNVTVLDGQICHGIRIADFHCPFHFPIRSMSPNASHGKRRPCQLHHRPQCYPPGKVFCNRHQIPVIRKTTRELCTRRYGHTL